MVSHNNVFLSSIVCPPPLYLHSSHAEVLPRVCTERRTAHCKEWSKVGSGTEDVEPEQGNKKRS